MCIRDRTPAEPGADTQRPTQPGTPTVTALTDTSVSLTWGASTDNVGVVRYDVVKVQDDMVFPPVSTTTTSITITGLFPNTAYRFFIYAYDAAGNFSDAAVINVTTPRPTPTPPACTATYQIVSQWPGGFTAQVVVRNTSASTINGWAVSWTFANGQSIQSLWNGIPIVNGANVIVRNATWNGTLAPNATTMFGFNGSWSGTNSVPSPITCLNV